MNISFEIDDSKVNGFSAEANAALIRISQEYAEGIYV